MGINLNTNFNMDIEYSENDHTEKEILESVFKCFRGNIRESRNMNDDLGYYVQSKIVERLKDKGVDVEIKSHGVHFKIDDKVTLKQKYVAVKRKENK